MQLSAKTALLVHQATPLSLSVADIVAGYATDTCPHCEKEVEFLYSCVYDKCQEPEHRVCVSCLKCRNEGVTDWINSHDKFNFEGGKIVGDKVHFQMECGGGGDHPWADHCFVCFKQVDEGSPFCWIEGEIDLDPKVLAKGYCGRGWCHECRIKAFGCDVDDGFKCIDCATPQELGEMYGDPCHRCNYVFKESDFTRFHFLGEGCGFCGHNWCKDCAVIDGVGDFDEHAQSCRECRLQRDARPSVESKVCSLPLFSFLIFIFHCVLICSKLCCALLG